MKDIKYIIKRVIIGVLTILAITFIKSNVFAYSYTNSAGHTVNEKIIYNNFKSAFPDVEFTNYSNVIVNLGSSSIEVYFFPNDLVGNTVWKQTKRQSGWYVFQPDLLTSVDYYHLYSNSSTVNSWNNGTSSYGGQNTIRTYTNGNTFNVYGGQSGYSYWGFTTNGFNFTNYTLVNNLHLGVLDFSDYLIKPYIEVSYLDQNYNIISSNSCIYTENTTCDLQINSNVGSYIQVSYDLRRKYKKPIDFLTSHTYKFTSYIYGSNNDIRLYTINPWFYWGDSTSNIDSELYFPIDKKIYYSDDKYKYLGSLTFNDDYTSYFVYKFVFTYKTNGSSLSTVKIPMNLDIADITEGSSPVLPPDDDTEIDKDDIIIDQNKQIIDGQKEIKDTLTNDNIDGSSNEASNFFSGFTTDTHGLTGVITAPLNLINSLTSKSCTPLSLPLPFVNQNLTIPCMSTIYRQHFGDFLTIYQLITFGFISYWVVVRIFNLVKDFKNPDHDEIEVVDL